LRNLAKFAKLSPCEIFEHFQLVKILKNAQCAKLFKFSESILTIIANNNLCSELKL